MTEADDVSIMNKAATQDLRAVEGLADDRSRCSNTPGTGAEHTGRKPARPDHQVGRRRARAATARKARKPPARR